MAQSKKPNKGHTALLLRRHTRTENSTIGDLYTEEGGFLCNTLEDKDRGLTQWMPLEVIKEKKVAGATAIPAGEYEIKLMISPSMKDKPYGKRYGGLFPCLLNVPGYSGVEIHPGTKPGDTRGCPLPGEYNPKAPDQIINSRKAYYDLMDFYLMPAHTRGDLITIKIE